MFDHILPEGRLDNHLIFAFLDRALAAGKRAALVTLVGQLGSSIRDIGAHMAVSEDGDYVGSFSGGCIERAVAGEAQAAINAGRPRVTRFGAGSKIIDIRLPCGGTVMLHFQPWSDRALNKRVVQAIGDRQPFGLDMHESAGAPRFVASWQESAHDWRTGMIRVGHWPRPRLMIAGHGTAVSRLAELGKAWGADIVVRTPDAALADDLAMRGFDSLPFTASNLGNDIASDLWTAIVFLFHDHAWEAPLLARALALPYFFVGAMGSRRAHEARCRELAALGVDSAAIAAIASPIGLIHRARDPETLALSALAQIAERHRAFDFASADLSGTHADHPAQSANGMMR